MAASPSRCFACDADGATEASVAQLDPDRAIWLCSACARRHDAVEQFHDAVAAYHAARTRVGALFAAPARDVAASPRRAGRRRWANRRRVFRLG